MELSLLQTQKWLSYSRVTFEFHHLIAKEWRRIQSVELSIDEGQTWVRSHLFLNEIPNYDKGEILNPYYGWVRFSANIDMLSYQKKHPYQSNLTVMCRATDEVGLMQPEIDKK